MYALHQRAKKLTAIISLTLMAVSIRPSYGQGKQPIAADFANARSFLGTMYPELEQKGLTIDFTITQPFDSASVQEPRNFSVLVRRGQYVSMTKQPGGTPAGLPDVRLNALFSYDEKGRITRFSANAPWPLTSDKNEEMLRTVDAHPEWSDQKIIDQLREAGARFTPKNKAALLQQLPIAQLSHFLGDLTVTSAEFQVRHENPEGEGKVALLSWNIEVEARTPDGDRSTYFLVAEAFGGRIIRITRRSE